jgi:hypothetical protein
VDLEDMIGPLPAPLGRWMLRRLVAAAVRYGHEFTVLLVRGADPQHVAGVLRGADLLAHSDGGDLLALLPDTDRPGAEVVAERLRQATGARVGAARWSGDLPEDMLERAARSLEADVAAQA